MSFDWILLGLRLFTVSVLYTFLGVAFYIIWRDLKHASHPDANHHLRLLNGDKADQASLAEFIQLQMVTYIGRDPTCTIVVADDATSNQHACLFCSDGVWWLKDLGSRNGTLLNDLPLSKPTSLAEGDVIGIGNIQFKFESGRKGQ
jgi:predicted component of type VI protein secretion system